MKLKPEVRKDWIVALRSDKYKQGKFTLCRIKPDGEKHCCLGVLCEVAIASGLNITKAVEDEENPSRMVYGGADVLPPVSVSEWAGVSKLEEHGKSYYDYRINKISLPHSNDCLELSFAEIADLLENDADG